MTVGRLHKLLTKMIEQGHSRACCTIYKNTFAHNLDEVCIHEIRGVNVELVVQCDDDGGSKINRDGSEAYRLNAVFYGASGEVVGGFVKAPD